MKKTRGTRPRVNVGKAKLLGGTAVNIDFPFDPAKIRFTTQTLTVGHLLNRLRFDEIDLEPEFQRRTGIWKVEAKSRLIESLLIRLPLATLIFDATDMDRWIVIDGLQRLTVLKGFILDQNFVLKGLEFLTDQEGNSFTELPKVYQRRILETPLTTMLLEYPTPPNVKFVLFQRFNTGGTPLNAQEARHAMNPGPVAGFLKGLAESEEFLSATGGISSLRMTDRECVLRVLAFTMTPYEAYQRDAFHLFLNATMIQLNQITEDQRQELARDFLAGMVAAKKIFGQHAFRKWEPESTRRWPVNKQLLEVWGSTLAVLPSEDRQELVQKRRKVCGRFQDLLKEPGFKLSISQSTSKPSMVKTRFSYVEELIRGVLQR